MKKFLKRAVSFALAVLVALSFASCSGKNNGNADREPVSQSQQSYKKIGSGSRSFYLDIEFENGSKSYYEVSTDKEYVGEALKELKIIDGENGPYGLYVLTVDGETHEYEESKMFWELSVDGTPSPYGVDKVKIQDGEHYSFSVES